MEVSVLIDKEFKKQLAASWIRGVAEQALAAENVSPDAELSVVITGQDRVRELNRIYRGKDRPTDVLAFAMSPAEKELEAESSPFVTPPDGLLRLGEVIISYPQAVIQAQEHGHPIKRELAILVIHGVLHLLGHDDEQSEPRRKMKARERQILRQIEQSPDTEIRIRA